MEAVELKFLNVLMEKLHLTDEEKIDFIEDFEKVRESRLKSTMGEFRSLFKEDFHRMELKMEQNKSDIDLKFEQFNTKFEQFDRKLDQTRFDLELKIERFNTISVRWFISLFVAVVLLILGLYFKK